MKISELNITTQPLDIKVVTWEDWLEQGDRLKTWRESAARHAIAVVVSTDLPIDHPALRSLGRVDKIVIDIGVFTDGRSFGLARIFREKLGFAGQLEASGDYLPDQVSFLRRCGFDSFAGIEEDDTGTEYYSGFYQPGSGRDQGHVSIRGKRLSQAHEIG